MVMFCTCIAILRLCRGGCHCTYSVFRHTHKFSEMDAIYSAIAPVVQVKGDGERDDPVQASSLQVT